MTLPNNGGQYPEPEMDYGILRSDAVTPDDVTEFSNKHRFDNNYCTNDNTKHCIKLF